MGRSGTQRQPGLKGQGPRRSGVAAEAGEQRSRLFYRSGTRPRSGDQPSRRSAARQHRAEDRPHARPLDRQLDQRLEGHLVVKVWLAGWNGHEGRRPQAREDVVEHHGGELAAMSGRCRHSAEQPDKGMHHFLFFRPRRWRPASRQHTTSRCAAGARLDGRRQARDTGADRNKYSAGYRGRVRTREPGDSGAELP